MGFSVAPVGAVMYSRVPVRKVKKDDTSVVNFTGGKVAQAKMMADFTNYAPYVRVFSNYKLPIHNESIAGKLRQVYTSRSFKDLYDYAKHKGVFNYVMNDKTGLVKTSFIETEENELMSDMIWITDTCNNMALVKQNEPQKCTEVFNRVTEFYEAQQGRFD